MYTHVRELANQNRKRRIDSEKEVENMTLNQRTQDWIDGHKSLNVLQPRHGQQNGRRDGRTSRDLT